MPFLTADIYKASSRLVDKPYSYIMLTSNKIIRRGKNWKLSCKREIILSGGVFGSAQILLLSGVGPAEDLNKLEVHFSHTQINLTLK